VGQTGPDNPPANLVETVVDLLLNQLVLLDSLPQQHELKNQFIHRLLNRHDEDDDDLIREGQILGMDLTRPRAVLLIDASEFITGEESVRGYDGVSSDWLRAQSLIREIVRFFRLPSDAICAYQGKGEIAVLKATSSQDLRPWIRHDETPDELPNSWSDLGALKAAAGELTETLQALSKTRIYVGVGRYHSGMAGLARSYQDASTALAIGRRLESQAGVYCLDQLGLAALVGITDQETRVGLAHHLLGPLESESELIHTLIAFFEENCSVNAAASKLFVHRNTLNYRLEKIRALTGLDPRRFDEAVLLRYALVICQLSGVSFLCN
jgi:carbohydrate diacid regulator